MLYSPNAIRTVGMLRHAGCGKTSLAERRSTMCDFDPLDTHDDRSRLNNITDAHGNYTIPFSHYESVRNPMAPQHQPHVDGAA